MTATKHEANTAIRWPYRMSYELSEKIEEWGVIRNEEHVTPLDGILVQSGPKTPPYCTACNRGREVLWSVAPDGWLVRSNQPVVLRDGPLNDSVPEPEFCLVLGPNRERSANRHPGPADVALVVLIVATAPAFDFESSGLWRYAFAGIVAVWVVSLHDRRIFNFTEPSGPTAAPGYARVDVRRVGDSIEATLTSPIDGRPPAALGPIAVASFFPPAG